MTHLSVPEWGRAAVGEGGFSRTEANELLAAARAHPLGGTDGADVLCDHYRFVRAQQMVGVVAGRNCSLEILPKIDPLGADEAVGTVRSRLVHMLDVTLGLDLSQGQAASMAHRASSLLEIFITLFADRLLSEVRRGLPRRYRDFEDDLRALRGRLDVVRQFTSNAVRPDRLACRFDALDGDTPLMQVMKACVLLLIRHSREVSTQRKLAELRFLLTDVSEVSRRALPWRQVHIDRTSRRWKVLLEVARLLLGAHWQQTHAEAQAPEGITLLFPMNELFERYIAVQLRRAMAGSGLDVVQQGGLRYCLGPWNGEGGFSHFTKPDILIRSADGEVKCIIDTKWKPVAKGPAQGDVYQMMAYARLYACQHLILLYPATPGLSSRTAFRAIAEGSERLDIATTTLEHGAAEIQRALRRLVLGWPGGRLERSSNGLRETVKT